MLWFQFILNFIPQINFNHKRYMYLIIPSLRLVFMLEILIFPCRNPKGPAKIEQGERLRDYWKVAKSLCQTFLLVNYLNRRKRGI